MAFKEPTDPFVEKLEILIDNIKQDISHNEFNDTLKKIDEQFPFVDLLQFLEMYVDGNYAKDLIEKFHLFGFTDYYKLLQILKLNKKRGAVNKNFKSREINLEDKKLAEQYKFLNEILTRYHHIIKNKINFNVLRSIIIFQLFSNGQNFTNREKIFELICQAILNWEHLVLVPHSPLLEINNKKMKEIIDEIIINLKNNLFLEIDVQENIRLEKHQLFFSEYIFNIIKNRVEGVTYQQLIILLKEKLPIIAQIPNPLIVITINDLIEKNQIIRKNGYWKFKPYFDQYFTVENYKKINNDDIMSWEKNSKFYGRKITPEQFISELIELEKGNFDDQDDQVTRIAGMILTNSNMMRHPPNDLNDFDFAIDLSNYELTREQENLIDKMNIQINSQIIYVKVMINQNITEYEINQLKSKLFEQESYQQGFIISFSEISDSVNKIFQHNKTIQIISKNELKEWCKITPIIPSRRGSVAIIRQGHNRDNIVKIKSINYESGRADIIMFPNMEEKTCYIGVLEEITLPVSIKKFIEYSDIYFQFLIKLYQISQIDTFRNIISEKQFVLSGLKKIPEIKIEPYEYLECHFQQSSKTRINLIENPDKVSLKYSTKDLFSCTCFQWNQMSRTTGLCDHLIFTLNESVKEILSLDTKSSKIDIEHHLQKIEQRMDLFLYRLRYSNTNVTEIAKCPNCGDIASTLKDVEERFGYRQMKKENKFSIRRQSRCKKCR